MGNSAVETAEELRAASLTREAAKMRVEGLPWSEIAVLQGAADESVPRQRVDRYIAKLPKEDVEHWKKILLARLDKAHRVAEKMLDSPEENTRLKAALVIATISGRIAKITGIEKSNVFVQVNPGVTTGESFDLSRLSLEEIKQLREMKLKMSGPAQMQALDVVGHAVTEETEEEDHAKRSERSGDQGQDPDAGA